ncbi:N(4)-(beta-N-acetylglucosaminyl)-L-asparaginase [uncultured Vagococcus sp.]|uniref:N(4)-(beta-N-acetylglucosaminyl)-L-asparaginase n=1 Tax=uncultured Vagococcus sp. TaxID=189676 RepID=UPI0028D7A0C0|nr:N(4)-(beta-N-acetylglucosaminyl)-L-asparaginase [uncultured Vagococcus sp.]
MSFGMIATWRMAYEGVVKMTAELAKGVTANQALVEAIKMVEDYPYYKSVGFGGLPNEEGQLELDAAFMDGDTLDIGAVAGIQETKNPIVVAEALSHERFNSFLVGLGATKYAKEQGFEQQEMVTERAKRLWELRLEEVQKNNLSPYDGHDTVGMISLDQAGKMVAGTSSSGLFMKKRGRVGDSPLSGSGFYVDSQIGGATATGLGEDLMKGCLSYETVRLMGEGLSPQAAVDQAVYRFNDKLVERKSKAGALSLVCMNPQGQWGIATNVEFSFVVATETEAPEVYIARPEGNRTEIVVATKEWLKAYDLRIKKPLS